MRDGMEECVYASAVAGTAGTARMVVRVMQAAPVPRIWVHGNPEQPLTAEQARRLADTLYAAANVADLFADEGDEEEGA